MSFISLLFKLLQFCRKKVWCVPKLHQRSKKRVELILRYISSNITSPKKRKKKLLLCQGFILIIIIFYFIENQAKDRQEIATAKECYKH